MSRPGVACGRSMASPRENARDIECKLRCRSDYGPTDFQGRFRAASGTKDRKISRLGNKEIRAIRCNPGPTREPCRPTRKNLEAGRDSDPDNPRDRAPLSR